MKNDTIAALATPAGAGGVAVVRVSGPRALRVLRELTGRDEAGFLDRMLTLSRVRNSAGDVVDTALCVAMRGPRSYTGEDVVEVQGHGGVHAARGVLNAVLEAGARLATPGEFTRRAFENGRLDLAQAEAVLAMVEAESDRALRVSQRQLEGSLSRWVNEVRDLLASALAEIEAYIDFPEEDLPSAKRDGLAARVRVARELCESAAASFRSGRALRGGVEVALVGQVNVGKSSLFNALVGDDRALVDEEPGTTRDFVEVSVVWDGIPVTLVDSAGLRDVAGRVESRGIAAGQKRARSVDIVVEVVPVAELVARDFHADRDAGGPIRIVVGSKLDLVDAPVEAADGIVMTSAASGHGVLDLRQRILEAATPSGVDAEGGLVVTSARQGALLRDAVDALSRCESGLMKSLASELMAADLRAADLSLAEVLGVEVGDDVLDALFSRFCIGK